MSQTSVCHIPEGLLFIEEIIAHDLRKGHITL